MSTPHCPEPASISKKKVQEVADDLLLTAEEVASTDPENPVGLIRSAVKEFARRLGVDLAAKAERSASTFPPEYEATGELTLAFQMDRDAEDLADSLDREQRAHEQTRQGLVQASREAAGLRLVALAGGAVLSVCDSVTTMETQAERLLQLNTALTNLRAVLDGAKLVLPVRETVANLIMLAAMRSGGQGRDFNAYEAGALVEAWFLGEPGQPKASPSVESDSRYRVWLSQWTVGRMAEREAQLRAAAEPFLQLARDRLARRSWEPIPDTDCRRLLEAFDIAVPEVGRG